jgi:hypothetical protein
MEKLLKLINEYEESRWNTIDDWLTEEERENWAIIEETPTRKEYQWHLRHCNAKTVAYEKDTFDAYALSKKYGFIRWLVKNDKIDRERINDRWWDMSIHFTDEELFIMSLSISNTPIEDLISYLK